MNGISQCGWRRFVVALCAVLCSACSGPAVKENATNAPAGNAPVEVERAKEQVAQPPAVPPPPVKVLSAGEQDLDQGVKSYEEGAYKVAAKHFQSAIAAGLPDNAEVATAHKYLAFVACISRQIKLCRAEFHKAIDADPGLDLEPAEAGHPIWGPVFRSVKKEIATKSKRK